MRDNSRRADALGPLFARPLLATRQGTIRRWHWHGPALLLMLDGREVGTIRSRREWGKITDAGEITGPDWRWIYDGPGPHGCGDCETREAALAEAEEHVRECRPK